MKEDYYFIRYEVFLVDTGTVLSRGHLIVSAMANKTPTEVHNHIMKALSSDSYSGYTQDQFNIVLTNFNRI